uniref:Putative LOV domain-containing protein n=1 Tax=Scytosiphon lomentaria TaxID=27967 RepID=A0A126WYC1_SCYLO|nr:putative LOV domain-containing protein [Scytosiphon lomentaria]
MGGAQSSEPSGTPFKPAKLLSVKDTILVDMVNGPNNSRIVSYCVTDPDLEDNPIIFCSDGFAEFTGYAKDEVEGRNCRFLQGAKTDPGDITKIREAVKEKKEACLCLLNYKKDGSIFHNQFFLTPLFDAEGKLAYYLGIQVQVKTGADGQEPENPGWVYTMGLHA